MSFAESFSKSRGELVRLVTGKSGGRAAWWYVRVHPQKLRSYLIAVKGDAIDFTHYGEVLFKGWGEAPPDDIRKKIESGDF